MIESDLSPELLILGLSHGFFTSYLNLTISRKYQWVAVCPKGMGPSVRLVCARQRNYCAGKY